MEDTQTGRPNTKAELRSKARRLFARHGYEGVSMRDIAGSVGIRQSAIYNHFPSKQHLLVDLMSSHMERVLDAMRQALGRIDGPPAAKLEAFARFHVTYHIDHPDDVFLAYMELRSLEAPGRDQIAVLRNAYEAVLRDILDEGCATGSFAVGNTAIVARGILAMLTGVTVWYRVGGPLDRETVAETYVQAVLQSVGLRYPAKA